VPPLPEPVKPDVTVRERPRKSTKFVGTVALAPTLRPAMCSRGLIAPLNSSSPALPRKSKLPVVAGSGPGAISRIDDAALAIA